MKFSISAFSSRYDLEKAIKSIIGTDIQKNKDEGHTIEGKRKEFKKFQLDDNCSIFGVRVVITDEPTEKILKEKTGKELYKTK